MIIDITNQLIKLIASDFVDYICEICFIQTPRSNQLQYMIIGYDPNHNCTVYIPFYYNGFKIYTDYQK